MKDSLLKKISEAKIRAVYGLFTKQGCKKALHSSLMLLILGILASLVAMTSDPTIAEDIEPNKAGLQNIQIITKIDGGTSVPITFGPRSEP